MDRQLWDHLGGKRKPSWYLDPITAGQKREAHLRIIRDWTGETQVDRILKTDLFEEAFGSDSLLQLLFPKARLVCGLDAAPSTVQSASQRHKKKIQTLACDVRHLAIKDCSVDVVVSTSTLDHFDGREEFVQALAELARVLKPGGLLIITLDNPWNPLYHPLRWLSLWGMGPFPLGYTESAVKLERDLDEMGLRPYKNDWLLHNPRGVSTLLFLVLRKMLRQAVADRLIRQLQRMCEYLGRLPTRKITACFIAVAARKPREGS